MWELNIWSSVCYVFGGGGGGGGGSAYSKLAESSTQMQKQMC